MMRKLVGATWTGKSIVITGRVKPGKLYKFERYLLVHPDMEDMLIDWIISRVEPAPRAFSIFATPKESK